MKNQQLRVLAPLSQSLPMSCFSNCMWKPICGGLDQNALQGCFQYCANKCQTEYCDWVCPQKRDFLTRWRDCGAGRMPDKVLSHSGDSLPIYIPTLRDGRRRDYCVNERVVAIRLGNILRRHGRIVSEDPIKFRDHFGVPANAQVVINSVQPDVVPERFWQFRKTLISRMKGLGIALMTVPNYSFFDDAPRTDVLHNFFRMMRVIEELSEAGIPVAPHLNANTTEDWRTWKSFLRDFPNVVCVAKEFQTGHRFKASAEAAIRNMRELQEATGRPLHPFIVGGNRHAAELIRAFGKVTFTDQVPFSKATVFQRAELRFGKLHWVSRPQPLGTPIDDLVGTNITNYRKYFEAHIAMSRLAANSA